jgi:hypothetical protein
MGMAGSAVNISAELTGDIWDNALGVQNLQVRSLISEAKATLIFLLPVTRCPLHCILLEILTLEKSRLQHFGDLLVSISADAPIRYPFTQRQLCDLSRAR